MAGVDRAKRWRRLRAFALAALASALAAWPLDDVRALSLQEMVQQCGSCHGETGNSKIEKIPSLAGQPELFLVNQLILFREKLRKNEAMLPFVTGLPDDVIQALAAHFSKQPVQVSEEPVDAELAKRGEALSKQMLCGSCHLPTLAGREQMPRLAGQRVDYLVMTLESFRAGARYGIDTSMNGIMAGVSDADIRALAHYAASVR